MNRPAWDEAGRLQYPEDDEKPRAYGGIFDALESLRQSTVRATVIVDAGRVVGVVGEDIAVLPDLSPLQVPAIEQAKAVIAETGGPASHLAIVARGQDLTVLRVPGACERFEDGMRVVLDPKAGTVTIEENEG